MEKKIDKRSKAYRDSVKDMPTVKQARAIVKEATHITKVLDRLSNKESAKQKSHQEQLCELQQDNKNLWATVKVLQEQVNKLQVTVG